MLKGNVKILQTPVLLPVSSQLTSAGLDTIHSKATAWGLACNSCATRFPDIIFHSSRHLWENHNYRASNTCDLCSHFLAVEWILSVWTISCLHMPSLSHRTPRLLLKQDHSTAFSLWGLRLVQTDGEVFFAKAHLFCLCLILHSGFPILLSKIEH